MEISESLSNSWLSLMGTDSGRWKIISHYKEFEFARGPILFYYGNGKSNLSDEIEKQKILRIAREECCTICGVHLEKDERNSKLCCTVCYNKKADDD